MSFCVYDNPQTMMREAWQNGKCLEAISWLVIELIVEYPSNKFPFYFNHGPFKKGQVWGDEKRLSEPENHNNETR